jgi:hypothetical protein
MTHYVKITQVDVDPLRRDTCHPRYGPRVLSVLLCVLSSNQPFNSRGRRRIREPPVSVVTSSTSLRESGPLRETSGVQVFGGYNFTHKVKGPKVGATWRYFGTPGVRGLQALEVKRIGRKGGVRRRSAEFLYIRYDRFVLSPSLA